MTDKSEGNLPQSGNTVQQGCGALNEELAADASYSDREPTQQLDPDYSSLSEEEINKALERIQTRYLELIKEYREHANLCVKNYKKFRESHLKWRRRLVTLTGILAIVNLVIAFVSAVSLDQTENEATWNTMIEMALHWAFP